MESNEILECPLCLEYYGSSDIIEHMVTCELEQSNQIQKFKKVNNNEINLDDMKMYDFDDDIMQELLYDNDPKDKNDPNYKEVLTKCQKMAFEYCKEKSKKDSLESEEKLIERFEKNGYTQYDIPKVIIHIKQYSKITINVNLSTILTLMINDDHYKNGFEIGRFKHSSGGGRKNWENNLFNSMYKNCDPIERVKYGAVNIYNEVNGIKSCAHYGNVFFVLKDKVKDRATFVYGDSSAMMKYICTFEYCTHLLLHLQDNELTNVIKHVLEKKKLDYYIYQDGTNKKTSYSTYIEAQIHGKLRLNTDIEGLCIKNEIYETLKKKDTTKLSKFCEKNNILLQIV